MESPASGADSSSSDADSRPSTPSHVRAVRRCSGYAELSFEGRLIKWWEEVRASDRQPWHTPVPSPHAPYHHHHHRPRPFTSVVGGASSQQPSKSGGAPATTSSSQLLGQRTPSQARPAKAPKRKVVTLVSPPGSRSCGPFMCHGLHNNYLIDEHSASLKETPSAARLAAERKKASAPKPFLVGGRGAAGAANAQGSAPGGRRPAPWRPTRARAVRDPFPFALDASEEDTRKSYREWQQNCSLRVAALQIRKLRQHINARNCGPSGAVGSGDALKVGDCLRVLTKPCDVSEEEVPGEDDPGLTAALLILSSDTQLSPHAEKATTPPSKRIEKEYKQAKVASLGPKWSNLLGFRESKPIQTKIRVQKQRVTSQVSFPLANAVPTFGRREPERKFTRQKCRSTIKVASRSTALKKAPFGGKHVVKKSVSKNGVESNSGVTESKDPEQSHLEVKSCVEGTRSDKYSMFGSSPASAHTRGVPDAASGKGQHGGHSVRRRSESHLVSAAASEAAKWLANRSGPRRQAAGLPVVQLLLPNPMELRSPPGDSRTAAVGSNATAVARRPKATTIQPSLLPTVSRIGSWSGGVLRPTGERQTKKWMAPPRRRATPMVKGGTGSALRRCFGESMSQFQMDEIEDALVMDWPELAPPRGGPSRTMKGDKLSAHDGAEYSDNDNEYLELARPEHNTNAPSRIRMLGSTSRSLFGRGVDEDAALMRQGFTPKQKTSMETQVTPRETRHERRATTTGCEAEPKRSVEMTAASTGMGIESALPYALRRGGANQAFKAVLDMVVQEAEGRGGAGGDVDWAVAPGVGDTSLFRNFLSQALNAENMQNPSSTLDPRRDFKTRRDLSSSMSRGTSKYVREWRNPHPKSAEESIMQFRLNSARQNRSRDMTLNTLLERAGPRRCSTPKSPGRKTHLEAKSIPKGFTVDTEKSAYPFQLSPRQVPAINRTKALTAANLGDLASTLRRAEKLS